MSPEERDRLQRLHLALEGAFEQLSHAQMIAAQGCELGAPSESVQELERVLGELVKVRNAHRDRLMKVLAQPALNVVK